MGRRSGGGRRRGGRRRGAGDRQRPPQLSGDLPPHVGRLGPRLAPPRGLLRRLGRGPSAGEAPRGAMGDDFHGGGAALSAPPLGGLGNFKGVMLCNRPSDDAPARASDSKAAYKSPFEHLGLPPCKRDDAPASAVKKRGPSAALRQHVRWLRELQDPSRSIVCRCVRMCVGHSLGGPLGKRPESLGGSR